VLVEDQNSSSDEEEEEKTSNQPSTIPIDEEVVVIENTKEISVQKSPKDQPRKEPEQKEKDNEISSKIPVKLTYPEEEIPVTEHKAPRRRRKVDTPVIPTSKPIDLTSPPPSSPSVLLHAFIFLILLVSLVYFYMTKTSSPNSTLEIVLVGGIVFTCILITYLLYKNNILRAPSVLSPEKALGILRNKRTELYDFLQEKEKEMEKNQELMEKPENSPRKGQFRSKMGTIRNIISTTTQTYRDLDNKIMEMEQLLLQKEVAQVEKLIRSIKFW